MKPLKQFAILAAVMLLTTFVAAQPSVNSSSNVILGQKIATAYGQWRAISTNTIASGAHTMTFQPSACTQPVGTGAFVPFSTASSVLVNDANAETVTPSAVTYNGSTCSITATFSNAHTAGASVISGTYGLQEAINSFTSGQTGSVIVTPGSGITTGMLTAATGTASIGLVDLRGQGPVYYGWSGTAYAAVMTIGATGVTGSITASGLPQFPSISKTTTYPVVAADFTNCRLISVPSGTFTTTLVAAASQPANGQCVWIINYGTGTVTVARNGQNINGATTSLSLAQNQGAFIVSDGANYVAQAFGTGSGGGDTITSPASTITVGGTSSNTTVDMASGVVAAGTCTNCNLTLDTYGRVTLKGNGTAGSGVTSINSDTTAAQLISGINGIGVSTTVGVTTLDGTLLALKSSLSGQCSNVGLVNTVGLGTPNTLACINGVSAGYVLTDNGVGVAPTFQAATGGGNVSNSGTPLIHQTGVFVDATHIKGIANGTTGQCWLAATGADPAWGACPGGSSAFSSITTGTNTAALHMGTGGSLDATGTGTIAATSLSALTGMPSQAADTVVMNATSGSASPTAYAMPACTTGASLYNTSTHAWSCVSGGSSTASTWFGPKVSLGVGQGAVTLGGTAGCSLVGSFPATGAPTVYGIAATTTYRQTCRPQFATTTVVYYADTLSNNYPANSALTFRIKAFHPSATTGADTFGIAITCTSATAEPTFSSVQNFAAVNVIGTAGGAPAGQNEEQVELTLTPGSGGIPACGASDTIQMSPTLVSTTASDNPVIVFFGGRF